MSHINITSEITWMTWLKNLTLNENFGNYKVPLIGDNVPINFIPGNHLSAAPLGEEAAVKTLQLL